VEPDIGEAPSEITDEENFASVGEASGNEGPSERYETETFERKEIAAEDFVAPAPQEPEAVAGAPAAPEAELPEVPAEEPPRSRNRRSRSRRGRGRGKKGDIATPTDEAAPAQPPIEQAAPEVEPKAAPKRGRRPAAAKGRGRKRATNEPANVQPAVEQATATNASEESRSTASSDAQPLTEVKPNLQTRRSADKHLADDEPIAHEPLRHPRHYRDLDQIPEEYD